MIRIEEEKREEKHVTKQAKPAGVDTARQVEHGKGRFDRTAYQREYMRRWRAKRQEKDRSAIEGQALG
jgi:hypothetical protein